MASSFFLLRYAARLGRFGLSRRNGQNSLRAKSEYLVLSPRSRSKPFPMKRSSLIEKAPRGQNPNCLALSSNRFLQGSALPCHSMWTGDGNRFRRTVMSGTHPRAEHPATRTNLYVRGPLCVCRVSRAYHACRVLRVRAHRQSHKDR